MNHHAKNCNNYDQQQNNGYSDGPYMPSTASTSIRSIKGCGRFFHHSQCDRVWACKF